MPIDDVYQQKIFTHTLTSTTFVILSNWGVTQLSIKCNSVASGSVIGSGSLGGQAPDPVTLSQGDSVSYMADSGKVLVGITITAPAGCSLQITGTGNAI